MLIPIQHLLDVDVITPEFIPSGEVVGEPTIVPVPAPRRVSAQGATWVAVLGGAGPAANDSDIRRELEEHLAHVGKHRIRRMARRGLDGFSQRQVRRMRDKVGDKVRFETDDFEDFEDDLIQVGEDGHALETATPAPVARQEISLRDIGMFAGAAAGSFAVTHTASVLMRSYFAKRWPDVPPATAPVGIAGLVTLAALALKFHRLPIAIGAGLAALIVASSRTKRKKNERVTRSRKRRRQQARRASRKKR